MISKPVSILYEDGDVLVVNKPAGLIVHSDGKTVEPTLVDWVLKHYPEVKGVGEPMGVESRIKSHESRGGKEDKESAPILDSKFVIRDSPAALIDRSGIVHRLDRETSGVVVIAKNQKAFEFLKKQFQEREMEKTYRAFVYGEVKNDTGIVDRPIARSTSDFRKWTATRGRRGKEREAVTEYQVLARFQGAPLAAKGAPWKPESFSFIEVRPRTGRTHQIRVHLKALNHPVVCDKLYAAKLAQRSLGEVGRGCLPAVPNAAQAGALGFTRLALHAFSLKFKLLSGKELTVEAPYPKDFKNALRFFERKS